MQCETPIFIRRKDNASVYRFAKSEGFSGFLKKPGDISFALVPCGKCEACLKRYVAAWSARLALVARGFDYGFFVTLTYSDDYLPENGVSKHDVQCFFKRIRKSFSRFEDFDFKYVLISEYGPSESGTHRPHYHFLSFSNHLIDFPQFWSFGLVTFDEILPERIHYVCSHHITKNFFVPPGKNPNFRLSSNGLGYDEFLRFELENARDNNWEFIVSDGVPVPIHRYFKDKFDAPPSQHIEPFFSSSPPLTRQQVLDHNESIRVRTENFIKKQQLKKSKFS